MQDAIGCVFHVFPEMRIRVYVNGMRLFFKRISMDVPERTRKFYEPLKIGTKKVHLEESVTKGDKESKSKLEVSDPHLRQRPKRFGSEGVVFCVSELCSLCRLAGP